MELDHEDSKLTPRQCLGQRVQRMRDLRGLTQRELAHNAGGFPRSYIGRVENGEQLPSEKLVRALDAYLNADGVLIDYWLMAQREVIPDYSQKVVGKEPEATRISVFNSSVITALLQTEAYMRPLFRRHLPDDSEEQVDERVTSRLHRQRIFERTESPYYWAIIDESALNRLIGGKEVMIEQMDHLLMMAKKPRITIQVISFENGEYPLLGGSLTLHSLPSGKHIGSVESFDSGEVVESPRRLAELENRFQLSCSLALSDDDSTALIKKYRSRYQNGNHP